MPWMAARRELSFVEKAGCFRLSNVMGFQEGDGGVSQSRSDKKVSELSQAVVGTD